VDVEAAVREVYLLACLNECVINRNNNAKGGVVVGGRRSGKVLSCSLACPSEHSKRAAAAKAKQLPTEIYDHPDVWPWFRGR